METSEDAALCPVGHRVLGGTLWAEDKLQDESRQDHQHGQHISDALQKEKLSVRQRAEQRRARAEPGREAQPSSGGCDRDKRHHRRPGGR